jgi:MFS transporter, OPA family, glycerol-3-phosphate transporter
VLFVGRLSDHVGSSVRLVIAIPLLALAVVALSLIGSRAALDSQITGLILLSGVAFLLIGPYSLLAGAIAMELGGRRGSATAAGLIDSAGYLGAVLSGWGIGSVAERSGWTTAFQLLAIVAAGAVLATLAYWALQQRAARLATARGQA